MAWPQPADYYEAVQNPATCFQDAELRQGQPALNALGLPLPRSGNFADVYELRCPGGRTFAVKCFTREVKGLRERYQAVSDHLARLRLPFMVDFQYQQAGVRIRGDWYPLLKMQWVEGFALNEFVKKAADTPAVLGALAGLWLRLARELRRAGAAHGDLQHGNVLLVPVPQVGSVRPVLIDYDGLYVPALARLPSGEAGHPAYQHPQRLRDGTYGPEVDRFAHLVIFTALRCVMAGGRALWDRYDNGDNLLFREQDLREPGTSPLFQELWRLPDPAAKALVGHLLLAALRPLDQVPLLEQVIVGNGVRPPAGAEVRHVDAFLARGAGGVKAVPKYTPGPVRLTPAVAASPAWGGFNPVAVASRPMPTAAPIPAAPVTRRPPRPAPAAPRSYHSLWWPWGVVALGSGLFLVVCLVVIVIVASRPGPVDTTASAPPSASGTPAPSVPPPEFIPPPAPPAGGRGQREGMGQPPPDMPRFPPEPRPRAGGPGRSLGVPHLNPGERLQPPPVTTTQPKSTEPPRTASAGNVFGERLVFTGFRFPVSAAAFLPDGKRALVGDAVALSLWNLDDPKELYRFAHPAEHLAVLPGGGQALVAQGMRVVVWDLETGAELRRFDDAPSTVYALAVSADGKQALTGAANGVVQLWDVATGKETRRLAGHRLSVDCVTFGADGLAASGGRDGTVFLWNLEFGQSRYAVPGHDNHVLAVAFTPDGRELITADRRGLRFGDVKTGRPTRPAQPFPQPAGRLAFTPDARRLVVSASSGGDTVVAIWDVDRGRQLRLYPGHHTSAGLTALAISPDGRQALTGGHDKTARLWDLP